MKHNFKIFGATLLIGIVMISSCAKKIDEAYKNPNAAVRQPVEVIFPAMIGTMLGNGHAAANSYGLGGDILNIGRYIQYWNSYQTSTADNVGQAFDKMSGVTASGTSLINVWSMYYWTHGQNLNRIIDWAGEEQKWDFVGAAWALRAWGMLEMTNEYGEGILREAFDASRQQFAYNDQSEFYDSVRVTCHRALSYLNMTGGGIDAAKFTASDFYFNKGDLNKWKKLVYGVLARSYAYIHNKSSYSADSVIKYANLSCSTNGDNNYLTFQSLPSNSPTKNYMGTFRANVNAAGTGLRQSAYIANLMSGANTFAFTGTFDPRCWYILRENNNGTFKGYSPVFNSTINPVLPLGDSSRSFLGTNYQTSGGTTPAEGGRYIFRDDAPFPIMTASEMQLIAAEAYLRKGLTNESRTAYINAISLNFDMLVDKYSALIPAGKEITSANKAAYLADPAIVPASAAGMNLTRIMLQKYIALYGWGVEETWVDMRRYHYTSDIDPATGNPVYAGFIVPSGANLWSGPNGTGSNNGKLVQRVRPSYNSEYLYNIPALTSVGAYPPGNDYHTKEMWFSKP